MTAARYWQKTETGAVRCDLCPHHCVLGEGQSGLCRVRTVRDGELRAEGYGLVSSAHVDPIEKKPLYHFMPGSGILSVGGWGCNLACDFCQNWQISQRGPMAGERLAPEDVVEAARRERSPGIAYTYNEPLVGFEFVQDCCRLARPAGLTNVLVTNGHVEAAPAAELLPWVDACNVDIKSMDEAFYRTRCRGRLDHVLRFCVQARQAGCHVEITNLVIPGANDAPELFERLAAWMADNLGPAAPLHLSAYHPAYRSGEPATPPAALERAHEICRRRLHYVYVGNVMTEAGQNTACPQCAATLVERLGYRVTVRDLRDGKCARCGRAADFAGGPRPAPPTR